MALSVRNAVARKPCRILPFKAFGPLRQCRFNDNECYRLNPRHVLSCHSKDHIPLTSESCANPRRLGADNIKTLFHQTSVENMIQIAFRDNYNIALTARGLFGDGFYLAESVEVTDRKSRNDGVVLCGEFDLGTVKTTDSECPDSTRDQLHNDGFSTLLAPKGIDVISAAGTRQLGGTEYVITDPSWQFLRGCWRFLSDEAEQEFKKKVGRKIGKQRMFKQDFADLFHA